MSAVWDDVSARVRGLGTHLLDPARLEALARATDLSVLAAQMEHEGFRLGLETAPVTSSRLEAAIRRRAAARLRLLARWCGPRTALLAVIFEDEDRRSLSSLARGAAEGTAPANRLQWVIPTPSLPERGLEELASQTSPRQMGALLAVWNHPYAKPFLEAGDESHPDLFRLECGLGRRFGERASSAARKGDAGLREYVATTVDLENLNAALIAAEDPSVHPDSLFIRGGARLLVRAFAEVVGAGSRVRALAMLARHFRGTPFHPVLNRQDGEIAGLPEHLERVLLSTLSRQARREPLTSAPVLAYALAVRSEVSVLQRIVWGAAMGAPPAQRRLHRVSAA